MSILSELRLAVLAVTGEVVIGKPSKDGRSFTQQKVVTNDFRKAVIEVFGNAETTINAPDGKWLVTVQKIGR